MVETSYFWSTLYACSMLSVTVVFVIICALIMPNIEVRNPEILNYFY
jgi:phage shock protein PspC (stress-responsive transcriptional regulator)